MPNRTATASSWLLTMVLAFLTTCGSDDCTDLGCPEDDGRAVFSFDEPAAGWEQEVHYRFAVTGEGGTWSCEGTLADGFACDSDEIRVQLFGSGSGDEIDWSIEALTLTQYPGPVTLRVEREGQVVHEQFYDIVAELSYPNGEGCPPECRSWSESVAGW